MQTQFLDGYEISNDVNRLNVDVIHRYLATESYWAPGIPRGVVEKAIQNSVCFGVYAGTEQVGFARVVTDKSTFAYLADVFIIAAHRGKGLSARPVRAIWLPASRRACAHHGDSVPRHLSGALTAALACYCSSSTTPAVTNVAPAPTFQVRGSPRNAAANITTSTTLSLSIGATADAGPSLRARK